MAAAGAMRSGKVYSDYTTIALMFIRSIPLIASNVSYTAPAIVGEIGNATVLSPVHSGFPNRSIVKIGLNPSRISTMSILIDNFSRCIHTSQNMIPSVRRYFDTRKKKMPRKPKDPSAPPPPRQTPAGEAGETFVAKLSIKALGCDPRLAKGVNKQVLCRIYGKAQGLKMGEDKIRGDVWTALQGTFEGQNCQVDSPEYGKTLQSGKLFLPAGIQDVIEGAVREITKAAASETASVNFALELSSVKADNPIGYSYQARNLVPQAAKDELGELRAAVTEKVGILKALPAPAA